MEDIFYILFTWGQTLFNEGITGIGATLDYNFIWALVILPYT